MNEQTLQHEAKRQALLKEKEENQIQLEQAKHQAQRLGNRIQHYTKQERKARNHRLIQRAAYIEKIVPDTIFLSDADYFQLMELAMNQESCRRFLLEHRQEG